MVWQFSQQNAPPPLTGEPQWPHVPLRARAAAGPGRTSPGGGRAGARWARPISGAEDAMTGSNYLWRRPRSSSDSAMHASTVVNTPTTCSFWTMTAHPYLRSAISSATSSSGASGETT